MLTLDALRALQAQPGPTSPHPSPQQHRVTNWPAYEAGLRQRGGLTVWFTDEAIEAWAAAPRTTEGRAPVLAGVDAASTYCYILAAADRCDADTWGVHLLDAATQGLRPDDTIADAGQGLRAGQRAAWGETPCHGDVFHIVRRGEGLVNALQHLAQGATSRRKALQAGIGRAGQRAPDRDRAVQLRQARQAEAQAHRLAW